MHLSWPVAEEDSPILWRKCFLLCRICLVFKYVSNISLRDLYPTPLLQSSGPHPVLPCRNVRRKFDARSKTVSFFPSLPSFPTKWMVGRGGRPSPPLFCKGGPRKIAHHPLRRRRRRKGRAQRLRINGEVHRKIRVSPKQETGILKLFASLGNLVKNSQTVRCALAQSP